MNKFEHHYYFKHKNCMDVFIIVDEALEQPNGDFLVYAQWLTQGTAKFWNASNQEKFIIEKKQYDNWLPYTPAGEYLAG